MRVLVLGRLFSGLKAGLAEGRWVPRGVPAFYKLVEGLYASRGSTTRTVLAAKDYDPRFTRDWTHESEKVGRLVLLGWQRLTGGRLPRIDLLATEAVQLIRVLWQAIRFRPDVIYATYAMLFPAAVLSRLSATPVVLRLMGIFPHQRAITLPRFWLHRWALASPFKAVVCTEDGSDPGTMLPQVINPQTELVVRLNGCDLPSGERRSKSTGLPLSVLFVGRLEPYKGCDVFVDAALACLDYAKTPMRFTLIGDGPLRDTLEDKVRVTQREDAIVFTGAVPQEEVQRHLLSCDIYVSVNLNGNLSNANLEALAAGACLVIPTSDPRIPIDTVTDKLLPDGVVVRYERSNLVPALSHTLSELGGNPARIKAHQAAARQCARELLKSWPERIEEDIALLRRLVATRAESLAQGRMLAGRRS